MVFFWIFCWRNVQIKRKGILLSFFPINLRNVQKLGDLQCPKPFFLSLFSFSWLVEGENVCPSIVANGVFFWLFLLILVFRYYYYSCISLLFLFLIISLSLCEWVFLFLVLPLSFSYFLFIIIMIIINTNNALTTIQQWIIIRIMTRIIRIIIMITTIITNTKRIITEEEESQ